jgi:hypothetical protein
MWETLTWDLLETQKRRSSRKARPRLRLRLRLGERGERGDRRESRAEQNRREIWKERLGIFDIFKFTEGIVGKV